MYTLTCIYIYKIYPGPPSGCCTSVRGPGTQEYYSLWGHCSLSQHSTVLSSGWSTWQANSTTLQTLSPTTCCHFSLPLPHRPIPSTSSPVPHHQYLLPQYLLSSTSSPVPSPPVPPPQYLPPSTSSPVLPPSTFLLPSTSSPGPIPGGIPRHHPSCR